MTRRSEKKILDDWRRRAEALLKSTYAIDFTDAGLDAEDVRRYASSFPDAKEFVDWFGEKYDLTTIKEFNAYW